MATQKKLKRKQSISKRTVGKQMTPVKKLTTKKRGILKRNSAKKKPTHKKIAKTKLLGGKTSSRKTVSARLNYVREKSRGVDTVASPPDTRRLRSGGQSGDLQGLSSVAGAESESVNELLEEGNAFEADVVKGVEDAGRAEGKEVRTHEVPEDDVPGEYLDKD